MVRQVIDYEEQARQVLLRDAPTIIEDKVWRAFGLLRYARSLSFEEAMNLLSGVRLGVGIGLISGVGMYTLNKLLVYTQPAIWPSRTARASPIPSHRFGAHNTFDGSWKRKWTARLAPGRTHGMNAGYPQ